MLQQSVAKSHPSKFAAFLLDLPHHPPRDYRITTKTSSHCVFDNQPLSVVLNYPALHGIPSAQRDQDVLVFVIDRLAVHRLKSIFVISRSPTREPLGYTRQRMAGTKPPLNFDTLDADMYHLTIGLEALVELP